MKNKLYLTPGKQVKKVALFIVMLLALTGHNSTFAQVSVSAASSGTNLSADNAADATSGAYTTLGNIVITESNKGDFANGTNKTLILTAPSGWQFQAGTGSSSAAGGGNLTVNSTTVTSSTITINISVSGTNKTDVLTITGLQVQATTGATLPASGSIFRTTANPGTATITGITNGSTNFGSLSQIAGALAKFAMPSAIGSQTAGTAFSVATITAQDQFSHTLSAANGNAFNSTVTFSTSASSGSVSPATSSAFTNGVLSTQNISVTQATTQSITANSGSISNSTNSFAVNAGAFTKMQVILPGESAAPGSSTGKSGTPNPATAGIAYTSIIVNAVDANWNIVTSAPANSIAITSTDANAVLPSNNTLSFGTRSFNVTFKTAGSRTVTATNVTDGTKTASTSTAIPVNAAAPSQLQLLLPGQTAAPGTSLGYTGSISAATAGTAFNMTVNAVDAFWNVVSTVGDNIQISSTDANALLPTNATLTSGTKTFSFTFKTAGTWTITPTDLTNGSLAITSSPSVTVSSGTFTKLQVILPGETAAPGTASGKTGSPNNTTDGTAYTSITVRAVDANWNLVSSAPTNTIAITSSDANASLPANNTLTSGQQTFSVTFKTAGTAIVTATNSTNGAITANTSSSITVNPGAFSKLQILLPGESAAPGTSTGKTGVPTATTAGTNFNVTVNAVDANWNIVSSAAADNIQLTSTDLSATMPANAALSSGTVSFMLDLVTNGSKTITASDATNSVITSNTSAAITVSAFVSQSTDYFRSQTSGNWSASSTWQGSHNNTDWFAANAAPTNTAALITVQNGHVVSMVTNTTADGVVVNAGGEVDLNAGITLTISNGTGIDFDVFGTFKNNAGGTITTTGVLAFENGGVYKHNFTTTAGTIPAATWNPGSNCQIIGYTSNTAAPAGLGQTFSGFTWACTSQTGNVNLAGAMANAGGTLTISSTGTGSLSLSNSATAAVNVGGFSQSGGTFYLNNGGGTNTTTLNISGNWSLTGGTFTTNSTHQSTVNFNGSSAQTISGNATTTFYNLVINENASATTVTSTGNSFLVGNVLTVTQGNLILASTNANYTVASDLIVSTGATLTHSVSWDTFGLALIVSGNISIDGLLTHTVRSTTIANGAGKSIRSGSTTGSAFDILLIENSSGTISASGTVTVNDNFWSSIGVAGGTFSTNGQSVTANAALLNDGGTVLVSGGSLNISGGLIIGETGGLAGNVSVTSGTLKADGITVGDGGSIAGTLSISGGTANIGNMTINSNGTVAVTNSPAINVTGNWTDNGTYTKATETITFNGTGAQAINGTATSQSFGNMVINSTPGQTVTVGGSTATLTAVSFTETTGNFTSCATTNINGPVVLTAGTYTAGTNTNITGNFTDNGGAFSAGSGTVTFNGASQQTIGGSTSPTFNKVILNNTNGLLMSGVDVSIGSTLTLTNGKVTTGANTLYMTSSSNTSIASVTTSKYIYGNLSKGIANGSGTTQIFEIGDATNYTPVNLTFAGTVSGSGSLTAYTVATEEPNHATSAIDETEDVNRYWSLANNGVSGFTSYGLTLNFVAGDVDAGAATSSFIVGLDNGGWTYPTVGTKTTTSTQATGLTAFGSYAVGQGGAGPPTMHTQPGNASACINSATSISTSTNSVPASTVQWQINTGSGFTNLTISSPYSVSTNTVSGITTTTLSISSAPLSFNNYQYQAIFTNTKSNTTSNASVLTINSPPGDDAGADISICNGGSGSIGAASTSGHTYSWSPTTNLSSSTIANPSASPTVSTTYTLTETITATGCSASNSVNVTVNPVIAGNTAGTAESTCYNTTPAALTGSTPTGGNGTYTYFWESSTTSATAGFSAASGTNNAKNYSPGTLFQNTWFRRTVTSGGCTNVSTAVLVTVNALPVITITTNYCQTNGSVLLTSNAFSSYVWSTGATTQSITVDLAGIYVVTATNSNGCTASNSSTVAVELVTNGNFSAGNTGFTTQYTNNQTMPNGLVPEGLYAIGSNANNYHPLFYGTDHTTGTGNFMIVNGNTTNDYTVVWSETVKIVQNTDYYFSAYAMSMNQVTPYAQLQFQVNGVQIGTVAALTQGASSTAGPFNWTRFYGTWNSGSDTSAVISIVDLQTAAGGNDFGLDDISCSTLAPLTFTVAPSGVGGAVCAGDDIDLFSNVNGGSAPFTYSWSGPNSYSSTVEDPTISNSTTAMTGTYNLTVTNGYGCSVTGSTSITVGAYPSNLTITASASAVCSGSATTIVVASSQSGVSYQLRNNADNSLIGSAVAGTGSNISLPTGNLTSSTTFNVLATNTTTGCALQMTTTPTVTISTTPVLVITNQAACNGTINLTASAVTAGSTGGGTLTYWTTAAATTAVATPTAVTSGTYYIKSTVGSCFDIEPVVATISTSPVATFSYTGTPYCNTASNPSPTFSGGGTAGTFSSTTGLVFVSTSTGQVNLSASNPGTYTVTNKITPSGACSPVTKTSTITITAPPTANFNYTSNALCQSASASDPSPVFTNGAAAGTFSSSYGLTFISTSTGQIDLSASTPGSYAVVNTRAASGGCSAVTYTDYITINPYTFPDSIITSASPSTICNGQSTSLSLTAPAYLSAAFKEGFNGATNQWTTTNNSTGGTPANAAWTLKSDSSVYSGTTFVSNDYSQFYMSNSAAQGAGGTTATILTSPAISTVGYTSLVLDFFHYFRYSGGETAKVQVSINGTTWTDVATYTSTQGTSTIFTDASVDLGAYINQSALYIRFNYNGTSNKYYWALDNVSLTGYTTNYTYYWSSTPVGFASIVQNPGSTSPSTTTSYSSVVTNSYGCASTSSPVTVTVNPLPVVTNVAADTICSGASPNITLTSSLASSFTWTVGTITGSITGASAGSGGTINQALTNPGNTASGTVQYLVTPTSTSTSCAGNAYTITVTVNPAPAITNSPAVSICSAGGTNITLSSGISSTYAWTLGTINGGITGATGGSGGTINQTLTNPANNSAGSVPYIVTPTAVGTGCVGNASAITVTVNPIPAVTNPNSTTICSGTGPNITLAASTPSNFAWTLGTITNGVTGATASNGGTINQTLTTPGNVSSGNVPYIVTPTSTTGSCTGSAYTITVTVNPAPTVNPAGPFNTCQSASPTPITLTGAGVGGGATTGAWSITSGGGSLSSTVQTASPASVTYTPAVNYTGAVTLTLTTNAPGACSAISNTATVNVNPAPTVTPAGPDNTCQSATPAAITLTGASVGGGATTGAWSITSGGGSLSSTAQTSSPASVTYTPAANYTGTVTLTLTTNAPGTCAAISNTRTVNVNPAPTVTPGSAINTCQSASPSAITLTGASVGGGATTGAWSITSGGGSLSSTAQTSSPASVTYTAAANFNGTVTLTLTTNAPGTCSAVSNTRTINVNVPPTATATNTGPYCNTGGNISLSAGPTGLASYTWSGPNSFSASVRTPTNSISGNAGSYLVTVTDANGCSSTASTMVVVDAGLSLNAVLAGCALIDSMHALSPVDSDFVVLTATGGTAPYTFGSASQSNKLRFTLGSTQQVYTSPADNLMHSFQVSDALNCTASSSVATYNGNPTTIPYTAAAGTETAICYNLGVDKWLTFVDTSNNAIMGIFDDTMDLGTVTLTVYKDAVTPQITDGTGQMCAGSSATAMKRHFVLTSTAQQPFTDAVQLRLYFNQAELDTLRTASLANNVPGYACSNSDDVNSINDLYVTKYDDPNKGRATEDGNYANNLSAAAGGIYRLYGNNYSSSQYGAGPLTKASSGFTNYYTNGTANTHYVQLSVHEFSELWLHGSQFGDPLPVQMLYLEADPVNNTYIQLRWATAIEINNSYFDIERSLDGQTWSVLGKVEGHGNTTSETDYTYNDIDVSAGARYYYRLKQVDNNLNYKYTDMVTASLNGELVFNIKEFTPNPATESTGLVITSTLQQNITVDFYSMLGQKISSATHNLNQGGNNLNFNVAKFAAGAYTCVISANGKVYTRKLIVNR